MLERTFIILQHGITSDDIFGKVDFPNNEIFEEYLKENRDRIYSILLQPAANLSLEKKVEIESLLNKLEIPFKWSFYPKQWN